MPLDQQRTHAVPSHRRQRDGNFGLRRLRNSTRRRRIVIGVVAAVAVIVIGVVGVAAKEATSGPGLPMVATPSGWQMTFNSNLSGNTLDSKIWATCYWWASNNGCTNNPTVEKEWYLPSQAHVNAGILQLVAQPEAIQETENGKARDTLAAPEWSPLNLVSALPTASSRLSPRFHTDRDYGGPSGWQLQPSIASRARHHGALG